MILRGGPARGLRLPQDGTRTLPHMPVHEVPISAEWNVHRNRKVPVFRSRLLTVVPTGSEWRNDQFPPYATTSWNPLTPRHLTTEARATVTVEGDQRVPVPRTSAGLAWAGATSATTRIDAHAYAIMELAHRRTDLDME